MFLFIIPRTPINVRSTVRDELWMLTKKSLLAQTSKNWKAILVGDTTNENLDPNFFITLNFDEFTKAEKLKKALDHIEIDLTIKPEYLIRLDDDDLIANSILTDIEKLPIKYDCYYDLYHTYIDLLYLKISNSKNTWIANTVIHKYEHAINYCGPKNEQLLRQDHSAYWHIYYSDKNTFTTTFNKPIYYRILTPFSITGKADGKSNDIDWTTYLKYLDGYGPWNNLSEKNIFYKDLKEINEKYIKTQPKRGIFYWFYNVIKYYKNRLTN